MKWPELSGSPSRIRYELPILIRAVYFVFFCRFFFFKFVCSYVFSLLPLLWSWISSTLTLVFPTVMLLMTKLLLKVLKPPRSMRLNLEQTKTTQTTFFFLFSASLSLTYDVCVNFVLGIMWPSSVPPSRQVCFVRSFEIEYFYQVLIFFLLLLFFFCVQMKAVSRNLAWSRCGEVQMGPSGIFWMVRSTHAYELIILCCLTLWFLLSQELYLENQLSAKMFPSLSQAGQSPSALEGMLLAISTVPLMLLSRDQENWLWLLVILLPGIV